MINGRELSGVRTRLTLSVALPPALHFRDHIYRRITANQTSKYRNLDNMILLTKFAQMCMVLCNAGGNFNGLGAVMHLVSQPKSTSRLSRHPNSTSYKL